MKSLSCEGLSIGSEICFFKGKRQKPVAYTSMGKVILCKHEIPLGFAKVQTVEEKDKCYLVTAKHIIKDVYPNITYKEFLQVLPLYGYKVGFDRIFKHKISDREILDEHHIFAYNLQNKVVITAETFTWKRGGRVEFNSIDIYLPGISCLTFHSPMFSRGTKDMCVLNINSAYCREANVLSKVKSIMEECGGDWPSNEYPSLWTYEKLDNKECDEQGNWILGKWALQRLKLANSECLQIFKGCDWISELNGE